MESSLIYLIYFQSNTLYWYRNCLECLFNRLTKAVVSQHHFSNVLGHKIMYHSKPNYSPF